MILDSSVFIIEPLRQMTYISLEKEFSKRLFKDVLDDLFQYFSEIKEERTIYDVESAFAYIEKKYRGHWEDLTIEEADKIVKTIEKSTKNFIKKNKEKINLISDNKKTKKIAPYWIYNFDIAIKILLETIKMDRRRSFQLRRKSKYAMKTFSKNFEIIMQAVFLVLFRITEQIFMIINEQEFDLDKEIDLLIRDTVYLKNIKRIYRIYRI